MSKLVREGKLMCLWVCFYALLASSSGLAETLRGPGPDGRLGGTYRRALANNPATLDPAFVSDVYSRTVVTQLSKGLVQFDAHLNPVPAIAEFWEASRDGRVWTFTLRQGVIFHNGREVTAKDFVYSFKRLLAPKALGPVTDFLRQLQGADEFILGKADTVQGLKAIDRYTLQLSLTQPFSPSLTVLGLANAAVVPQEEVERLGSRFAQAPVGAGPFKLARWEAGKEIVLTAHEQYYEGRPFLDTVVFTIGGTFEQAFTQFLNGHLDEAIIPSGKTEEVQSNPQYQRYQMLRRPTLGLLFIGFNTQRKPFDEKLVRQAFNYGVDKAAIVRDLTQMGSLPANAVLPPGMPGHDPDLPGYSYDPAKAKRLLADAGYPNGDGLPVIQLWTVSKAESTKAELAAYQRYLGELGVKVEIHFVDQWTTYTEMLQRGELQMFRYAWYADFPDPDNFFFPLLHSTGQPNYMRYQNPQVDRLLEQAREESDYAHRVKLYREAERIVMEDAPWITQHNHNFEYLYQPYVRGVEVSLLGDRWIPMNKIWLEETSPRSVTGTSANVKSVR